MNKTHWVEMQSSLGNLCYVVEALNLKRLKLWARLLPFSSFRTKESLQKIEREALWREVKCVEDAMVESNIG